MTEIMRDPTHTETRSGEAWTFDDNHSLADIARWIMGNRSDAEDLHMILGQMLDGTYGERMQ